MNDEAPPDGEARRDDESGFEDDGSAVDVRQSTWWNYRWAWSIAAALVLAAAAPLAVWLSVGSRYQAEAWLTIENHRPFIAFPGMGDQKFSRTQVELIRSPVVLGEVVKRPEIAMLTEIKAQETPVEWLEEQVHVEAVNDSEIYRIEYEGPNPTAAQLIVNAVMDTYVKFQQAKTDKTTQQIIDLLERQKEQRISELERLQKNVREMTRQATGQDPGFVDPKRPFDPPPSPIPMLRDKLAAVEIEREVLEARLQTKRAKTADEKNPVPAAMIDEAIAENRNLQDLEGALALAREKLKGIERATADAEKNSNVRLLRDQAAELERSVAELKSELRVKYADVVQRKIVAERAREIAALEDKLDEQQALENVYHDRLKAAQRDLEKLGEHAFNLEIARGDMEYAEAIRDKIAERVMALRTEQNAPTQVSPIRRADVPVDPVSAPIGWMALASLAGFLAPLVIVSVWSSAKQEGIQ